MSYTYHCAADFSLLSGTIMYLNFENDSLGIIGIILLLSSTISSWQPGSILPKKLLFPAEKTVLPLILFRKNYQTCMEKPLVARERGEGRVLLLAL
jgi:hypothetical protein